MGTRVLLFLVLAAPWPLAAQPAAGPAEDAAFSDFADEFGPPPGKVSDPLEPFNRAMFTFNDRFYLWVWRPAARGWRWAVPEPARVGINNAFVNLAFPIRFANSLLQLKARRAGAELRRFLVNSTVGVAGLFDPATRFGWEAPPYEDFGQTLGRYGVGDGLPLTLPFLGPSNLRDALSMVPDGYLTPYIYVTDSEESLALAAGERFNRSSLHLGEYENLKKDALDPYTFFRDAYRQNRTKEISE